MSEVAAVILAAGRSTRMKSDLPKVLHEVCGRPMLAYVVDACEQAGVGRVLLVVGHGKEKVVETFGDRGLCSFVEQAEQKGTGHAVLCCREALSGFAGRVLVIAADMPLVRGETLTKLLAENTRTGHAITLATTVLDEPAGYGRIVRDRAGDLLGIVEHNDCTPEQREIHEVNPSYYCFDGRLMFEALGQVGNANAKGEYYITDAVRILIEQGRGGGAIPAVPPEEAMGINSRADLALVARRMQDRIQAGRSSIRFPTSTGGPAWGPAAAWGPSPACWPATCSRTARPSAPRRSLRECPPHESHARIRRRRSQRR